MLGSSLSTRRHLIRGPTEAKVATARASVPPAVANADTETQLIELIMARRMRRVSRSVDRPNSASTEMRPLESPDNLALAAPEQTVSGLEF